MSNPKKSSVRKVRSHNSTVQKPARQKKPTRRKAVASVGLSRTQKLKSILKGHNVVHHKSLHLVHGIAVIGLIIATLAASVLALNGRWAGVAHASTATCTGPCLSIGAASNQGYWVAGQDGGVFSYNTPFYGSVPGAGSHISNAVALVPTSDQKGYWVFASDGGVFAFGDAPYVGSLPGDYPQLHVTNVVGAARTADNKGYWLVGSDGGVFAFGDAAFYGSMGGKALNAPVVSIAAAPDGSGYWLLGRDGGVFAFGAAFYGAATGSTSSASGITAVPGGGGYWITANDGGVFSYGTAAFYGSMGGKALNAPMVSISATPTGKGYYLLGSDGGVFAFGDAVYVGRPTATTSTPTTTAPSTSTSTSTAPKTTASTKSSGSSSTKPAASPPPPPGSNNSPPSNDCASITNAANRKLCNQNSSVLPASGNVDPPPAPIVPDYHPDAIYSCNSGDQLRFSDKTCVSIRPKFVGVGFWPECPSGYQPISSNQCERDYSASVSRSRAQ